MQCNQKKQVLGIRCILYFKLNSTCNYLINKMQFKCKNKNAHVVHKNWTHSLHSYFLPTLFTENAQIDPHPRKYNLAR